MEHPSSAGIIQWVGTNGGDGHYYLDSFLGEEMTQMEWAEGKMTGCSSAVTTFVRVVRHHPQVSYSGMQSSLQQEWHFSQRITPGMDPAFSPVETALREAFLPDHFKNAELDMPGQVVIIPPEKETWMALL